MIVLGGKRWRKAVQSSDVDIEAFYRSLAEYNATEMSERWGYTRFLSQVARGLLGLARRLSALALLGETGHLTCPLLCDRMVKSEHENSRKESSRLS